MPLQKRRSVLHSFPPALPLPLTGAMRLRTGPGRERGVGQRGDVRGRRRRRGGWAEPVPATLGSLANGREGGKQAQREVEEGFGRARGNGAESGFRIRGRAGFERTLASSHAGSTTGPASEGCQPAPAPLPRIANRCGVTATYRGKRGFKERELGQAAAGCACGAAASARAQCKAAYG